MRQLVRDEFIILLPATDAVRLLGYKLDLSGISAFPQEHLRLCLILILTAQPDDSTPSVSDTMDREVALESMQFGRAFPRIIQAIW